MLLCLSIFPPQYNNRINKQITEIFLLFAFCNTLKETLSSAISLTWKLMVTFIFQI